LIVTPILCSNTNTTLQWSLVFVQYIIKSNIIWISWHLYKNKLRISIYTYMTRTKQNGMVTHVIIAYSPVHLRNICRIMYQSDKKHNSYSWINIVIFLVDVVDILHMQFICKSVNNDRLSVTCKGPETPL